jgi:hypothetical protein
VIASRGGPSRVLWCLECGSSHASTWLSPADAACEPVSVALWRQKDRQIADERAGSRQHAHRIRQSRKPSELRQCRIWLSAETTRCALFVGAQRFHKSADDWSWNPILGVPADAGRNAVSAISTARGESEDLIQRLSNVLRTAVRTNSPLPI